MKNNVKDKQGRGTSAEWRETEEQVRTTKAERRRGTRCERRTARRDFNVQGSDARVPAVLELLSRLLLGWLALALLVAGCVGPRPLKGGKAVTSRSPAGALQQSLVQSDNPAQTSKQEQETVWERRYFLPAGAKLVRGAGQTAEDRGQRTETRAQNARSPVSQLSTINYPLLLTEREETHSRAELGAAQKDSARELGAKLSSLRSIVWVGVGLFVFGLASLVYPPLKVVIGSVTTSAALMLGGVALMVLPTLVVGNELLILGVVGLAVGGWFLAHRHGQLRGEVSTLKAKG